MRNATYLFIIFILFLLTHCKKASDDLLLPIVKTGTYYPEDEVIFGEIENIDSNVYMYGHLWDTLPAPSLERYMGMSNFFNENDTIYQANGIVVTPIFDVNEIMTVMSHMDIEDEVANNLFYIVIYWKDIYGNRGYGEEIIVHICR